MNTTIDTDRPIFKVVGPKVRTYMGARAEVTEIQHDSKRDGLRTILTKWIDDATADNGSHPAGTVTRQVLQGNAWKPVRGIPFEVIEAEKVVA